MTAGCLMVTSAQVGERLKKEVRVLAVTHESPDGDALGCLSAFLLACERLGVECSGFVPGEDEFPEEYAFLPCLGMVQRGEPPQVSPGTTVYFFDCASSLRGGSGGFGSDAERVNIDHHQDNPKFAEYNLVDSTAPSTSAILYAVLRAAGVAIDAEVATALYVGLVTDTGRFQYSNTTPEAHRLAAELQQSGCDVNAVYRLIYERTPMAKLLLMQRMLARADIRLGGALVLSWLGNGDFAETGAREGHAEGLIDVLRCVEGVQVAVLARERMFGGSVQTKVSLRSTDGVVDVAELAHEHGGGGHARAAGFTSDEPVTVVLAQMERAVGARL